MFSRIMAHPYPDYCSSPSAASPGSGSCPIDVTADDDSAGTQVLGPDSVFPILAEPPPGCLTFAVRDDGLAPALRIGMRAVIDPDMRDPEPDAYVLIQGAADSAGFRGLARLGLWQEPGGEGDGSVNASPGWMASFGHQTVAAESGPPYRVHMAAGPLTEAELRKIIAGRVIGILPG